MSDRRTFAIVPAAGLSRRMGRPKLSLPLGRRNVLEHVLAALAEARLACTLVVLGPSSAILASSVAPPAKSLTMPDQTPDMRSTVLAGVRWYAETWHPVAEDALLLALGDQPTLTSAVVDALIGAHEADATRIRMPTYSGKRGHPLLLPWPIALQIAELGPDEGVNTLLHRHAHLVAELVVDSPTVLDDLDDPADYLRHHQRNW